MNSNCKNQASNEVEKAKLRYMKLVNINRIIDDQGAISKDEKLSNLIQIIKDMLEDASRSEKNKLVLENTISHQNQQIAIKNQIIQRYKTQILQSKDQCFKLEKEIKHLNNSLQQTKNEIQMKNQAMEDQKYVSTKKVLSMQSQVNFLLSKECKKQSDNEAIIFKKKMSVGNLNLLDKKRIKSKSKYIIQKKDVRRIL